MVGVYTILDKKLEARKILEKQSAEVIENFKEVPIYKLLDD